MSKCLGSRTILPPHEPRDMLVRTALSPHEPHDMLVRTALPHPCPLTAGRGRIVARWLEMANDNGGSGAQCAIFVGEISPAVASLWRGRPLHSSVGSQPTLRSFHLCSEATADRTAAMEGESSPDGLKWRTITAIQGFNARIFWKYLTRRRFATFLICVVPFPSAKTSFPPINTVVCCTFSGPFPRFQTHTHGTGNGP
jgi:hypothetical protein